MIHGSTFVKRLLRLAEYSFSLCCATCAHFGANFEMADEEMLLSLCAASVVAVIMERLKKKKKSDNVDSRTAKK